MVRVHPGDPRLPFGCYLHPSTRAPDDVLAHTILLMMYQPRAISAMLLAPATLSSCSLSWHTRQSVHYVETRRIDGDVRLVFKRSPPRHAPAHPIRAPHSKALRLLPRLFVRHAVL